MSGDTLEEHGVAGWTIIDMGLSDGMSHILAHRDIEHGFEAKYFCSVGMDSEDDTYYYDLVLTAQAVTHDCLRHLWLTEDEPPEMRGYIYLPDLPMLAKALMLLDELQLAKCPEAAAKKMGEE